MKRSSAVPKQSGEHRPFAGSVHTGGVMQKDFRVSEECHGAGILRPTNNHDILVYDA